jgi:hypothetical protein
LPNGQQASVDDVVVLQPGDDKQVQLSLTGLDFPATLQNITTFGDSVKEMVRPLTKYFSAHSVAILRGNWLAGKIEPGATPPTREMTTRTSIEVKFPEQTWVELIYSKRRSYLAVPVDELRSTTMQWDQNPDTGKLDLKFDFNDGKSNSFFDFIRNDQTLEARSIGQSIIAQSEQYMANKKRSPLCAILGAYVLLRANELDGMDSWTSNLASWCRWLPDALAVRVEYLARDGRHSDAFNLLLQASQWGAPWFRSGIGYLEKRAKIYASIAAGGRLDFPVSDDAISKIKRIADVYSELATVLDMTHSTSVLRETGAIT